MSQNELLDKIKKDIPKTGFVTEMLVTAMLRSAGWSAADHAYYMDRDENKGREIDVVAVKQTEAKTEKRKITLTLALAIEIKKVTSKPWIVFTSPKAATENVHELFATTLVRLNIQEIWFHDLYNNHAIANELPFGRVSYQAFQNKKRRLETLRKMKVIVFKLLGSVSIVFKASDQLTTSFGKESKLP